MKNILENTVLEYESSKFDIKFIKHERGFEYVEITQRIYNNNDTISEQTIKINPYSYDDVIEVLKSYQNKLTEVKDNLKQFVPEKRHQEIEKRYLKGIPLKDLSLQFNCSEDVIEAILRNRGIAIVSDNSYHVRNWWKR